MISMLKHAKLSPARFARRTYIVSSGDSFSARKAVDFERQCYSNTSISQDSGEGTGDTPSDTHNDSSQAFRVITIPRARRVHQSFWTAPFSTLSCLWACLLVLLGRHPDQRSPETPSTRPTGIIDCPDMIITNGPGTGVCVIVAAKLIRIAGEILSPTIYALQLSREPHSQWPQRKLRTIYIESWARVTTLSLSGKILLPLVDRFLVQWESLAGYSGRMGGKTEYVGTLLS